MRQNLDSPKIWLWIGEGSVKIQNNTIPKIRGDQTWI